jgi:hypothetical protein
MKWMIAILAATLFAVLSVSGPAPIFTTEAYAGRMDGKGMGCSTGTNCMQDRYNAAKRKEAKGKKPQ